MHLICISLYNLSVFCSAIQIPTTVLYRPRLNLLFANHLLSPPTKMPSNHQKHTRAGRSLQVEVSIKKMVRCLYCPLQHLFLTFFQSAATIAAYLEQRRIEEAAEAAEHNKADAPQKDNGSLFEQSQGVPHFSPPRLTHSAFSPCKISLPHILASLADLADHLTSLNTTSDLLQHDMDELLQVQQDYLAFVLTSGVPDTVQVEQPIVKKRKRLS